MGQCSAASGTLGWASAVQLLSDLPGSDGTRAADQSDWQRLGHLKEFVVKICEARKVTPSVPDLFTKSLAWLHMRASCNWVAQDESGF